MAGGEKQKHVLLWVALGVLAFTCLGLAGAGLLFVFAPPAIASAVERAEGGACAARLRAVYQGLILYEIAFGAPPGESGLRFVQAPYAPGELRDALEHVDTDPAAYFGRDLERFPMERFPGDGTEPLAACDNALLAHGRDLTHVLYADGSIRELSLRALKAEGVVQEDAERLEVGPRSPIADLRKLRRD